VGSQGKKKRGKGVGNLSQTEERRRRSDLTEGGTFNSTREKRRKGLGIRWSAKLKKDDASPSYLKKKGGGTSPLLGRGDGKKESLKGKETGRLFHPSKGSKSGSDPLFLPNGGGKNEVVGYTGRREGEGRKR